MEIGLENLCKVFSEPHLNLCFFFANLTQNLMKPIFLICGLFCSDKAWPISILVSNSPFSCHSQRQKKTSNLLHKQTTPCLSLQKGFFWRRLEVINQDSTELRTVPYQDTTRLLTKRKVMTSVEVQRMHGSSAMHHALLWRKGQLAFSVSFQCVRLRFFLL